MFQKKYGLCFRATHDAPTVFPKRRIERCDNKQRDKDGEIRKWMMFVVIVQEKTVKNAWGRVAMAFPGYQEYHSTRIDCEEEDSLDYQQELL